MLLTFAATLAIQAIPAYPYPVKLKMPDGTMLTVVGHGDEYRNYITTQDGYTIVRGEDKFFRYAQLQNGVLVASDVVAHEMGTRNVAEMAFLAGQAKNLVPAPLKNAAPRLDNEGEVRVPKTITSDNYKGLVVLVNFNDRTFRMGDEEVQNFANNMMSADNWTSYEDIGLDRTISTVGSVRDYFRDNSYGKFNPTFDVVGPVTIDYSCTYPQGSRNMGKMLSDIINAINPTVDFSQYDSDNNGDVDMIYFIFAGYASSYSGNNSQYLWPHASNLSYYVNTLKDGKRMGRYACSTELYGWEENGDQYMNGIGTICHEFSHVIGYMDHYDTTDAGNETPQTWDVMDAGSYNGNLGNCPAGYNAYERYTGGFLNPTQLTTADHEVTFELQNLQEAQEAFMIKTSVNKEYFLVENRQKVKWDAQLPGHGMLVWRVDSTNANKWSYNQVNTGSHTYFQLRRANGWKKDMNDSQADAFPGSKNVTSITNTTMPANLLTYAKRPSTISLNRIKEDGKIISFEVLDVERGRTLPEGVLFIETFDECDGTGGNDDIWNTSQKGGTFMPDNDGWTYTTATALNKCARFGSSALSRERVLSPTITLPEDATCTLTFKAGPYNTDGTALQLSVDSGDATLLDLDGEATEPAQSIVLNMTKNQWTEFHIQITGNGNQVLKFYGNTSSAKRFLLDEVIVYDHVIETSIDAIEADKDAQNNPFAPMYNLSGQRVSDNYRGIVIQNGKKYLVK